MLDSDLAEIYVSATSKGIAKLEVQKFHLKLERAKHLLEVKFFDLKFGLWKSGAKSEKNLHKGSELAL